MALQLPTTFPAGNTIDDNLISSPAPSAPLNHRIGAALFNGYLLLAVPRQESETGNYYLDLQYNHVETVSTADGPVIASVDIGVTCGIRSISEALPIRIMARMESFVPNGIPWVIWAEMPEFPGQTISPVDFYFWVPQFVDGHPPPCPPVTFTRLPSFNGSPAESLIDFTTASLNGKVFLLWAVPSDPTSVWYSTFDGTSTTDAARLMSIHIGRTICSIDATAVLAIDENSNQVASIAVVVLSTDFKTVPLLDCVLVNPLTGGTPQNIPMPVPILGSTPPSSIRVTWGSLPEQDGSAVTNGLVLHYVAAGLEGVTLPHNLTNFGDWAGNSYLNLIDLSPGQGFASQGWLQVTPSIEPNPNDLQTFVTASMTALFPITLVDPATGNALMSVGVAGSDFIHPLGPDLYLQTLPSLRLVFEQGVPQTMQARNEFDKATLTSIVSSWVLIGVVTGLPPYQASQNGVGFTYGRTSNTTTGTTLTSSHTLTLGATLLDSSISATIAASNAATQGESVELDVSISLDNSSAPPTHGWLILLQPTYRRDTYAILNLAGKPTGLTVTMLTIVGPSALTAIAFDLTAPNSPVDDTLAVLPILCQFPTRPDGSPLVSWPASDDLKQWSSLAAEGTPAFGQWMQDMKLTELSNQPSIISVGDNGFHQMLTLGTSENSTFSSTVTVTVGQDVAISILRFSSSGTLSIETDLSTSFDTSYQFSIDYGSLAGGFALLQIKPYLFTVRPQENNAPWVPKLLSQQRPWLLTWRILAFG